MRLDVPVRCFDAAINTLSGGERKRVQLATELLAKPSLLILDEPASGLDVKREVELMRLLRGLSFQGCTVVLVTHGQSHVDLVDRTIELLPGGVIGQDSRRGETQISRPAALAPPVSLTAGVTTPLRQSPAAVLWQAGVLLQRELARMGNQLETYALATCGLLPLFFAATLHVAVPYGEGEILGFLLILACIWLGASNSILTLAGEMEIIAHERIGFLRPASLILAKTASRWLLAGVQTVALFGWLSLFRLLGRANWSQPGWIWQAESWDRADPLLRPDWLPVLWVLILTSCAGASLGLLLSALATALRRRELANILLPLVMVAQIVFSVVARGHVNETLSNAYRDFSWPMARTEAGMLDRAASAASYLTISRHADVALRGFAYKAAQPVLGTFTLELAAIFLLVGAYSCLAFVCLRWQRGPG